MTHCLKSPVIESALQNNLGCTKVLNVKNVGGGCINEGYCYETDKGPFFVKQNKQQSIGIFDAEVHGLEDLHKTGTVRVPIPYCCGTLCRTGGSYVIMEYISFGKPKEGSQALFGEQLANLHAMNIESRFGYFMDNTLGSTPQTNSWSDNWVEFFIKNRLQFQIDLAEVSIEDGTLKLYGYKLLDKLSRFFEGVAIRPSLIHGDLWKGNFAVDEEGAPVIFDPAPYFAHHEAELSIMDMFGGFSEEFYEAYHARIPKAEGFEERQLVYKLYHYLNHLNLFGSSYYPSCISILKKLA